MTFVTVSASSTSPQSTLQSSPWPSEQASGLETAASELLSRDNVEKRILFHNGAIKNALAPSDLFSTVENGEHKCRAVIQGLQAEYDFDVDVRQLPRSAAAHTLLRKSEVVITLDTVAMRTVKAMKHFGPSGTPSPPLDSVSHADPHHMNSNAQALWLGLAYAYWGRYQHTQDMQDLKAQFSCATYALTLTTETTSAALLEVGSALRTRYERSEDPDDLASALRILHHARECQTQGNCDVARLSYELGRAYIAQYGCDSDATQLDHASDSLRLALKSMPAHSYLLGYVTHALAIVHRNWYQFHGKDEDANEELSLMDQALDACPLGHPYRTTALQGLGVSLQLLFNRSSDMKDLQRALDLHYEALQICQLEHPIRPKLLNGIGIQLLIRYQRYGEKADLDTAIEVGQQVLEAVPNGLPPLVNLANQLGSRFWLTGNINDLVESTRLIRRAISLCPLGHPHREILVNNLGEGLITRFEHTFDSADLEEGIVLLRESAALLASNASLRTHSLFNLANALKLRYQQMDTTEDLEEACELHSSWLQSHPSADNDHEYFRLLYNVANLRRVRHERYGDIEDLQLAIKCQEEAVLVQPAGNPDMCLMFDELAACYRLRTERTHALEDAEKALATQMQALDCAPIGQSGRSHILFGMAQIYLLSELAEHSIHSAIDMYLEAITDEHCSAQSRLAEGLKVIKLLQSSVQDDGLHDADLHTLLLRAYRHTVNLLPQIAYFGLNVQSRFHALTQAPNLAAEAAVHAMAIKEASAALEILEEGRAVFWVQFSRLRLSFKHLPPSLASELTNVARDLELGAGQINSPSRADQDATLLYETRAIARRQLSQRFEELLAQARSLPGLERFMLGNTVSALAVAARASPVVVLIATSHYCGALLLRDPTAAIEELRLGDGKSIRSLEKVQQRLYNARQTTRGSLGSRAIKLKAKQPSTSEPLNEIWIEVMQKVIEALNLKKATGRNRPRLLLCPTGQFARVPLHAASSRTEGCWDYCVPSYTPTLGILLAAREAFTPIRRTQMQALLAAVPLPFKGIRLPQTVSEVELLKTILPSDLATSVPLRPAGRMRSSATSEDIIANLPTARILHLACHGYHNPNNPLESGFMMHDKMLTVTDLMKLNLPHAFMAFLSACETAKTAADQPDQAVHLAATMLFTGFKSVVGTMWSMDDIDGPLVAGKVYEELFSGEDEFLDPDSVPYALDAAVEGLRQQKVHASRWASYVHFGI